MATRQVNARAIIKFFDDPRGTKEATLRTDLAADTRMIRRDERGRIIVDNTLKEARITSVASAIGGTISR